MYPYNGGTRMKSIYTAKIEEANLARFLPDVNMTDRDKEIVRKYLDDKPTYAALEREKISKYQDLKNGILQQMFIQCQINI